MWASGARSRSCWDELLEPASTGTRRPRMRQDSRGLVRSLPGRPGEPVLHMFRPPTGLGLRLRLDG